MSKEKLVGEVMSRVRVGAQIGALRALRIVDKVVNIVDDKIAGDGGARVELDERQRAQMRDWFEVTRPALRRKGIDISWGDPHS